MRNIIYILSVLSLCFFGKAQAQTSITEYQTKLNSLPDTQAQLLNSVVNGAPSMVFINSENTPAVYQRPGEQIKMMMLHEPSDLVPLLDAYDGQLDAVTVINIEWNGTDTFTFPADLLSKLPGLGYVYIRSYQNLSKPMIENAFQGLIQQLKQTEVDILYFVMQHEK